MASKMENEGIEALLLASLSPSLNYEFTLDIVQQPIRGRMCGMGDKDRRPLTPPLIVKLHCRDKETGLPITPDDIDTTFFILSADLRGEDHSNASTLYQPIASTSRLPRSRQPSSTDTHHSRSRSSSETPSTSYHNSRAVSPSSPKVLQPPPGCVCQNQNPNDLSHLPSTDPRSCYNSTSLTTAHSHPPTPLSPVSAGTAPQTDQSYGWKRRRTSSASGSHSPQHASSALGEGIPNLIGALHTNAFRLKDEKNQTGIFFVFPDLSVRSEGTFRIRLRLLSIGSHGLRETRQSSVRTSIYSQAFTVCSAKKFEGMIDPTPLSKCFAKQGVRIPTRRVVQRKRPRPEDEELELELEQDEVEADS